MPKKKPVKRKGTEPSGREEGTSKMQKSTAAEGKEQEKLYPADKSRMERITELMEKKHEQEVKQAFTTLEKNFKKEGKQQVDGTRRQRAFEAWCKQYADENFPGTGQVAYAVPHCFIGSEDIRETFTLKPESDVRAEHAHRIVERAFRLLSDKMERDELKPMVIIGSLQFENVLIWPEKVKGKFPEFVSKNCPCMGMLSKGKYCSRPDKAQRKRKNRGEADLIILHETKGIIFVEVKSYGTFPASEEKGSKGCRKKNEAYAQLEYNEEVFRTTMSLSKHKLPQVHQVFALPNLSKEDAEKRCKIGHTKKETQGPHLLSKDDLFDDDIQTAESDYDMEKLQAWWDKLPDIFISTDLMKSIVARYVGTLSRPLRTNSVCERSHVRTPCDAITLTGRLFRTLVLDFTEEQKEALSSTSEVYRRVHLKGPPGSGRTTMLFLKARKFLNESHEARDKVSTATASQGHQSEVSKDPEKPQTRSERKKSKLEVTGQESQEKQAVEEDERHVVVVDLYRGTKGRPIGLHIFNTISDAVGSNTGKSSSRVHYLPIDVGDGNSEPKFVQEVENMFGNEKNTPQPKQLLFVIDEVLPEVFWQPILKTFNEEYKESHVWCADGLVPQQLEMFQGVKYVEVSYISRLPPSIQRLLYHADWDKQRKESYSPDAQKQSQEARQHIVTTNGPTPVCVRHKEHDTQRVKKVIDCERCAEELAELLKKKLKLVETTDTEQQGGSSQPSYFLPSNIVILFSIPQTSLENDVETTADNLQEYIDNINNSKFLKHLRKALDPVEISVLNSLAAEAPHLGSKDHWHSILVSWTDTFQGLERDVVIFLPGDACETGTAPQPKEVRQTRSRGPAQSPTQQKKAGGPAARSTSKTTGRSPQGPGSPQPSTPSTEVNLMATLTLTNVRKIPEPGFKNLDGKTGNGDSFLPPPNGAGSSKKSVTTCKPGMAHLYWRVGDVKSYTDWDKTNLVFAATRCTAQLILLVP